MNQWKLANQGLPGTRSGIFDVNLGSTLREKYTRGVSAFPGGYADVYSNPTVDDKCIFLCTQAQYNDNQELLPTFGGEIIAFDRSTGEVIWRRFISEYSGVPGDYSFASPAVDGNYLYFATGITVPQSIAPYEDTLKTISDGVPVQATGTRHSLFCINKLTGDVIWRLFLGEAANHINDPDNWLYFLQSPIVTDTVSNRKVVLIGSASSQYFQSALYTNFYGARFPIPLLEQLDFQMTDIGRVFIVDADSGLLLKMITSGPPLLHAGDALPASCVVPPREGITTDIILRHIVSPDDLLESGHLNPIRSDYGGGDYTYDMTYVLEIGDGTATIPAPLDGIQVVDTYGNQVTLHAGDTITDALQNVVCTMKYQMETGTTNISFRSATNPGIYFTMSTTDPATGLAGQTGIRPVRIARKATVGEIMDAETAYQLNMYGACITGNTITVASTKDRFYYTTDQPHFVPYSQAQISTEDFVPFLIVQLVLWYYQFVYESDPRPLTYAAMQEINLEYAYYYTVYTQSMRMSERYASFNFSSIVTASLADDTLGDTQWVFKSTGYDYWTKSAESGRSLFYPYGYSNIESFLERPIGSNGGFGQGVYLTNDSRIVASNRAGFLYVLDSTGGLINGAYIGNSVVNGASNYGSTLSGNIFVTVVTQAYDPTGKNPIQVDIFQPLEYLNFPQPMSWYITPNQSYPPLNSLVQAWDINTREMLWAAPVIPDDQAPFACTLSQISSTRDHVFIPASNGILYIRDIRTGNLVHQIRLDGNGGQSSPVFSDGEMYAVLGRSEFASVYNLVGSVCHYGPARNLYAFFSDQKVPYQMSIQIHMRQYDLNNPNTRLGFFVNGTLETTVSDLYKIVQTEINREPPLTTLLLKRKWYLYNGSVRLYRQDRFTAISSLPRPSESSMILTLLYF